MYVRTYVAEVEQEEAILPLPEPRGPDGHAGEVEGREDEGERPGRAPDKVGNHEEEGHPEGELDGVLATPLVVDRFHQLPLEGLLDGPLLLLALARAALLEEPAAQVVGGRWGALAPKILHLVDPDLHDVLHFLQQQLGPFPDVLGGAGPVGELLEVGVLDYLGLDELPEEGLKRVHLIQIRYHRMLLFTPS